MEIKEMLLTHNRPYTKRSKTTAIAVHYVGNAGSSAVGNRNYFQTTSTSVSSHYIIGLDGEIIRCIPEDEVSWCTNQANSYTISIECCHPNADGIFNDKTYKSLVELCADICKRWNLNPLNGGIIRHFDVTGKVCPKGFVAKSKGGTDDNNCTRYNTFLKDVATAMGQTSTSTEFKSYLVKVTSTDGFVNIRKTPKFVDSDIVGKIENSNIKYTIVEETTVDGVKFGKLKSGAGWIALSCTTKVV